MSEQQEAKSTQKRKVGRSPAYPSVSIQKALDKVKALYEREGDYAAPLASATVAWGYSAKSSGGRQLLATLRYYGLIEVQGDGDTRKIKVSDIARRILLDQREDKTERDHLIKKVALNPAVHREIYEQYPSGLASDGSVRHFLMFDLGFNQEAAEELLAEFKETSSHVALYDPDKNLDKMSGTGDASGAKLPDVKVGDRVQWTNQGVDQIPNGATVLGFSDDHKWVFTDYSTSGLPLSEISIMEASPVNNPPIMPPHLAAMTVKANPPSDPDANLKAGSRKAVFPVEDGDVTLIFPEDISADGLAELGQYLDIFLKKEQKKKSSGT